MKQHKHHKRLTLNQETVKLLSAQQAQVVLGGIITTGAAPSIPQGGCGTSPGGC